MLLNNGDGTFAADVTYHVGAGPISVAVGDLDGDLDLDLAVANASSDDVSVLLNECPPQCPADLDGNGSVGVGDLLALFAVWGPCPGPPGCPGDFNNDGTVGVADLLILFANWGPCP